MNQSQESPVQTAANRSPGDADGSARYHVPSHLRLWLVAVLGLGLDLWTKHWAFSSASTGPGSPGGMEIIPQVMSFRRSLNTGALFGLGKGLTPVFILASFLAFGFVLFLFIHSGKRRWSLHVALGLVLAGALGNLYDRIFVVADVVTFSNNYGTQVEAVKVLEQNEQGLVVASWPDGLNPHLLPSKFNPRVRQQGVVRDFIKMEPRFEIAGRKVEIWPWVFNIADALLVVGVGVLMLNFWQERKAEVAARQAAKASAG